MLVGCNDDKNGRGRGEAGWHTGGDNERTNLFPRGDPNRACKGHERGYGGRGSQGAARRGGALIQSQPPACTADMKFH